MLKDYGQTPTAGEFREPVAGDGEVVVTMAAAGLHHVDRAKASGAFYLVRPELPSVAGSDGVGRLEDGRRVYVESPTPPFGTFAERALAPTASTYDVPEGISDLEAAAVGNTGMAAWLALSWRARLQPGETVLVLGAAGALGTVAVQAARLQGAGRVVGATRQRSLGRVTDADAVVALDIEEDPKSALLEACEGGADVIIDALWGQPALAAIGAAKLGARFVQLGHAAGLSVDLMGNALRAARLDLLAFAYVHAPADVRRRAYWELAETVAAGRLHVPLEAVPLSQIDVAWQRQAEGVPHKLVIDIDASGG